jgi:Fic family protein
MCKVHELVLGEASTGSVGEISGEYRRNSIYIGGLNCPAWELVPSLVKELIKYVQKGSGKGTKFQGIFFSLSAENPVKFAAEFYYRFSAINPFWDGNNSQRKFVVT